MQSVTGVRSQLLARAQLLHHFVVTLGIVKRTLEGLHELLPWQFAILERKGDRRSPWEQGLCEWRGYNTSLADACHDICLVFKSSLGEGDYESRGWIHVVWVSQMPPFCFCFPYRVSDGSKRKHAPYLQRAGKWGWSRWALPLKEAIWGSLGLLLPLVPTIINSSKGPTTKGIL